MSNCKKCQKLLPKYIDSSLKENKIAFVENHIEECSECKNSYQELYMINARVGKEDYQLEDEYGNKLLAEVNNHLDKQKQRQPIFKWAAAATAAIILIAIGITQFGSEGKIATATNYTTEDYLSYLNSDYLSGYSNKSMYLPEDIYSESTTEMGYTLVSTEGYESLNDLAIITTQLSEEKFDNLIANIKKSNKEN